MAHFTSLYKAMIKNAKRLGPGEKSFLNYPNRLYRVHYRGYPKGIILEIILDVCP
jgi:hypothetical protein